MAICPSCGNTNPDQDFTCANCGAYLPGSLDPKSRDDEGDRTSTKSRRRWSKSWSFLYTRTTVDWTNEDLFVVSHYMSPFINSERITSYGRLSWFAINTSAILLFAILGVIALIASQRNPLPGSLCLVAMFFLGAMVFASLFVWMTFVPPRN